MAKAKRSAQAELEELRQQAATERVKARDLEAQFEAAKLEVETAPRLSPRPMRQRTPSW